MVNQESPGLSLSGHGPDAWWPWPESKSFFGSFFSKKEHGFTLVEVLVALAIVATAFGFAFVAMPASLGAQDAARHQEAAAEIAQSVLDQTPSVAADGTQGVFAWHVETAALPEPLQTGSDFGGSVVRVTVSWAERGHTRSVGVQTVRLAPVARSP